MKQGPIAPFAKPLRLAALCSAAFALTPAPSLATYYETLPKGVRMFAFKQVRTGDIKSEFNQQKTLDPYFIQQKIDADLLHHINEGTQLFFDELQKSSPEAYQAFNMGEYQASGSARVNVQGYGLAYGLTNRLTIYGSLPFYDAKVKVNLKRTQKSNLDQVQQLIASSNTKNETTELMAQLVQQFPDANENLIQSVFVNLYNYQPIGDWQATGFGDLELGAIYRLTDWEQAGLATSFGVVLPTGRESDPDILQDIPFGDGQTDLWAEFGGGFQLFGDVLHFWQSSRYTYQAAKYKELRSIEEPGFALSADKAIFREKRGDMIDLKVGAQIKFFSALSLSSELGYQITGATRYESPNTQANEVMAMDTDEEITTLRSGIKYSSVEAFKKGKFFAPMTIGLSMEQMLEGKNTPEYTRFDLDFRLYF